MQKSAAKFFSMDGETLLRLINSLPLIIFIIDRNRRVLALNSAASGVSSDGAENKKGGEVLGCVHSTDSPKGCGFGEKCAECRLRLLIEDAFDSGMNINNREVKLRARRPFDEIEEKSFLVSCMPLRGEGDGSGVLVLNDISAYVRMRDGNLQDMKRFSVIGMNASGILHDIKSPLGCIDGYCRLLLGTLKDEKQIEFCDSIIKGAGRISEMLSELKDFVNGNTSVSINPVLTDAAEAAPYFINNYSYGIDLLLINNAQGRIMADRDKLALVFWNLASNASAAVQNVKEGRVLLRTESSGGDAFFEFIDNGPGVPPEKAEKLFEKPVQSSKENGSGLGLYGSYKIVRAHGGKIIYNRRKKDGETSFKVKLPLN
ncbi:MAG: two-component system sensor histidine kinase NtrB [Fibrobacterota bacterium]